MNALTEMLAKHKAIYKNRQLLGSAGPEKDEQFSKAITKSDRVLLKIAKMPCASDAEFFVKLAYIAEIEFGDYGDHEGRDYESLVCAMRAYLKQRRGQ
jgi:hypothetical protein